MYQFFVEDEQIAGEIVTITGSDVNHIRNVLRMKCGEKIRVSSVSGKNYFCKISEIGEMSVQARMCGEEAEGTELPCRIYLFQGLPKSDKMELIIQKAVELGAYAIVPVAMKNCVVKLDEKKAAGKLKRWQGIAESAAKQSKRSMVPQVMEPMSYRAAVNLAAEMDVKLVPYENERGMAATYEAIKAIQPGTSVGIFIGPEGGFTSEEIALARESGMQPISLGKRILRTETAGFTTLAIIMYQIELQSQMGQQE